MSAQGVSAWGYLPWHPPRHPLGPEAEPLPRLPHSRWPLQYCSGLYASELNSVKWSVSDTTGIPSVLSDKPSSLPQGKCAITVSKASLLFALAVRFSCCFWWKLSRNCRILIQIDIKHNKDTNFFSLLFFFTQETGESFVVQRNQPSFYSYFVLPFDFYNNWRLRKFGARLCFYTCLWFYSWGGVCLSACWDTTPSPGSRYPPNHAPRPGTRHLPVSRHPPGAVHAGIRSTGGRY